jgi:hypothetical protein
MSIPRITQTCSISASWRHSAAHDRRSAVALDELQRISVRSWWIVTGLVTESTLQLHFGIDDEASQASSRGTCEAEPEHCSASVVLVAMTASGGYAQVQMAMVWSEERDSRRCLQRFDGIVVGEEPGRPVRSGGRRACCSRLPFAPRHPAGGMRGASQTGMTGEPDVTETGVQTRENPFAVLAKYKERPH